MTENPAFSLACPLPLRHATIQLAHGGGGRLSRELFEDVFFPAFGAKERSALSARHDSAVVHVSAGRIAMTTDGYVVKPRFFPGGDIGKLAICGTVNDLAMAGALPKWIAASFVLEEGLPMEELFRIVQSMRQMAEVVGVEIVTGDTKVVDRGKGDGVFITTTGLGIVPEGIDIGPHRLQPGDAIIVSGDLGRHGIAVLKEREGFSMGAVEGAIESDCAPLSALVQALLDGQIEPHCLRDPTRGGLASALNEMAMDGGVDMEIQDRRVPVSEVVRGASELFGLDPLYIACEGRLVLVLPESQAERALAIMRERPEGKQAALIGCVSGKPEGRKGRVTLKSSLGRARLLDLFAGEQLPRIC